jgi:hypothetical protein
LADGLGEESDVLIGVTRSPVAIPEDPIFRVRPIGNEHALWGCLKRPPSGWGYGQRHTALTHSLVVRRLIVDRVFFLTSFTPPIDHINQCLELGSPTPSPAS